MLCSEKSMKPVAHGYHVGSTGPTVHKHTINILHYKVTILQLHLTHQVNAIRDTLQQALPGERVKVALSK